MKEKRRFPSGGRLLDADMRHYIVQSLGATFADFALIRRWRDTFPTRGKASFGCALLYVIPLSKRDPACWRPAWGGVRCAAMVGGRA